jgi:hypothetical protein
VAEEQTHDWSKLASDTLSLLKATKGLRIAMREKNFPAIKEYGQQVSLWMAKILTALPIAQQKESNLYLYRQALSAIFEAQQMTDLAEKETRIGVKLDRKLSTPSQVKAVMGSVLNGIDLGSVDPKTEQDWFQPIRLSGAVLGGPILVYAGRKLDNQILGHAVSAIGVLLAAISLWTWNSRRMQLKVSS